MNFSKNTLFVLFCVLAPISRIDGMATAKKVSSFTGDVIMLSLAGTLVWEGIDRLVQDNNDEETRLFEPEAPSDLRDFVRNVAKKEGLKDAQSLDVRLHISKASPYSTRPGMVLIDTTEAQRLVACYTGPAEQTFDTVIDSGLNCSTHITWSNQEFRARCLAMLSHELGHLKNNDYNRTAYACFAIPALTLLATRHKHLLPLINKNLFTKAATGVVLQETNGILIAAFKKHKEYLADDNVTEPAEMYALIKEFNAMGHAFPPNPSMYEQLKSSHPDSRYRIDRMAKRLIKTQESRLVENDQDNTASQQD